MKYLKSLSFAAIAALTPVWAQAQSFSYSQNFNGLGTGTALNSAGTGTVGWTAVGNFGGSNTSWDNATGIPAAGGISAATAGAANATLVVNSNAAAGGFSSNTAAYNLALSGSSDRALGTSPTSGAGTALQLTLANNSGFAITSINLSYLIRRFTAPAANSVPGYRLFYSLNNGTSWTNVAALNPVLSGAGVVVPSTAGVTTAAADISLSAPWFAGQSIRFRWIDDNALETSPDQILGLDNVAIVGTGFSTALAPTVTLTAPAAGSTYTSVDAVNLSADASDDGFVAKVEFFAGAAKIGEATAAPYTFAWTGPSVGTHSLTARATDNDGYATTSAGRTITVLADPNGPSGALLRGPYLNMSNDTGIVIRWRSANAVYGRVLYGTSPDYLGESAIESVARTDHEVRLTGLIPHTRYYYSVGGKVDLLTPELADTTSVKNPAGIVAHAFTAPTASDYTFRTSPAPGTATDTRIWVVGDAGRGSSTQAAGRNAYYNWMGGRVPDLNLQLGDNAYNAGTDAEYQTGYFLMYPTIFRKMPQWSTLGNHDANNGVTNPTTNFPYFDMFTFPTAGEAGGVPSGTEHYYSFDYGNIHVINLDSQTTLSSTSPTAPQTVWLQNDLASTTATWIIVIFHHPPYSKGSHNSDSESQMVRMRQVYAPILEAGGVDLVLTGHSHNYERSVLLDGHYGISSTITSAMKLNAGNGSTTGFVTAFTTAGDSGKIRNAATNFTAVATVNGAIIPPDGAYIKPRTGPRDHFGTVYNTAGMSGQADGGAIDHTAMYISYDTVGTVNIDINGDTLVATYVQADGNTPDNYTIIKQGAADSDKDGIADEYEIYSGLDRHDAGDADLDLDGDGLSNRLEFALGTAANVANGANPFVLGAGTGDDEGKLTLTFNRAQAGITYTVQVSNDLSSWSDLVTNPGVVGSLVTVTDSEVATGSRFLRLHVTDGTHVVDGAPVGKVAVALSGLEHTYDGAPKTATAATSPVAVSVTLSYAGGAAAPTNAGGYAVVATVVHPNFIGSGTATLLIKPAAVSIVLSDLLQRYDGEAKSVGATVSPAGLPISVAYAGGPAPTNPGSYAVTAVVTDPNYIGTAAQTLVIATDIVVRHAPSLSGSIDGSLQVLEPEDVALNGNALITGDLIVPGTPSVVVNGRAEFLGTRDGEGEASPSDHAVALNGNALLRFLVRRIDAVTIPEVTGLTAPAGTRDVSLNSKNQSPGNFATIRNLTLNGNAGPLAVPPGVYGDLTANGNSGFVLGVANATEPAEYQLENLALNGKAALQVVGPVILTLANGVAFNGDAGDAASPGWLVLRIASGDLTLNGTAEFNGTVLAPEGAVSINGNATFNGRLTSDRLFLNGNGQLNAR